MEFLEDERDAWEPYEALLELPEDAVDLATAADGPGHGWSARDLTIHMLAWGELSLTVARELALGERSETFERVDADWDARADAVNDELHARYAGLEASELQRRLRELPGELRGTLTVVPEARWLKHPRHSEAFTDWLLDHEAEHVPELEAVLELAGRPRST